MNTSGHPTERVLLGLADDEHTNDAKLVEARLHLEQCAHCQTIVRHHTELFARARSAHSVHVANDALFARIQRSRAMGTRVILPDADGPVQGYAYAAISANDVADDRDFETLGNGALAWSGADASRAEVRVVNSRVDATGRSRVATFAVAASLVVVALGTWRVIARPGSLDVTTSGRTVDSSPRGTDRSANAPASSSAPSAEQSLLQTLSPWPTMAYAQTPSPGRPAAYPAISGLDASRLREGRRWYLRSSANNYHDMLPHALTSVETARVRWKNKVAWRVITREPMRDNFDMVDTLVLMDSTLLPVFRRTTTGFMEVREEYADSVVTETFIMRLPPELERDTSKVGKAMAANMRAAKPMITTHRIDRRRITPLGDHAMRLLLQATPLTATWKASVGVFVRVLNSREQLRPAADENYLNLRVDGIDTIQVFNGRIEVWRVLLETGPKPEVWYVSRETGETILTEGAWGKEYPQSTNMLMGWHETKRLPPVRIR